LVGNSHVDSIKESFIEAFEKNNISVYYYVSNSPLMNEQISEKKVFSDAEKLGVSSVIFHFSPSAYNKKFIRRISELVITLKEIDVALYSIAPVPTYSYHIPGRMYETTVSENNLILGQPLNNYFSFTKNYWDAVSNPEWTNVRVFNTTDQLCPNKYCKVQNSSGEPLYFDNGHLTLTGANVLKPVFESIAEIVLKKSYRTTAQ